MSSDIGKGTYVVYLETLVNAITAFTISISVARGLSGSDFGLWRILASVLMITSYFASFGVEIAFPRFISYFLQLNQYRNLNKLLLYGSSLRLICISLVMILFYWSADWLNAKFHTSYLFTNWILITSGYIIIHHLNQVMGRAVLTGYSQRYLTGYIKIFGRLVTLTGVLLVIEGGMGLYELIVVLLVGVISEFIVHVFIFFYKVRENQKGDSEIKDFPMKRIARFALNNYFFQTGQAFREYSVDNFVISYYNDTSEVGHYSVATTFPSYIRSFAPGRILQGVLLPSFVKKHTTDPNSKDIYLGFQLIQKLNAFFIWPFLVLIALFANDLIFLIYGQEYLEAVPALRVLVAFLIIQVSTDPFYMVCNAMENSKVIFHTTIWGVLNLIGNIILVPRIGIVGAALSTGLISIGTYLHFFLYLKRKNMLFGMPRNLLNVLINMSPSVLLLILVEYFDAVAWVKIITILIALFGYLFMSSFLKVFSIRESSLIKSKLPFLKQIPFI